MGTKRGQSTEESRKTSTEHVHTGTYLVPVTYLVLLLYVRKKAHNAVRHSTATQGKAPYGTSRSCAALLSNI